jgi:hypothetical protein
MALWAFANSVAGVMFPRSIGVSQSTFDTSSSPSRAGLPVISMPAILTRGNLLRVTTADALVG